MYVFESHICQLGDDPRLACQWLGLSQVVTGLGLGLGVRVRVTGLGLGLGLGLGFRG